MLRQLDILIGLVTVLTIVSVLITVINQMIMSGGQFRGKRLMDALEVMFKTINPDLGDKAKAVAEAVLRHPIISDSARGGNGRGLASAIRPAELLAVLRNLAGVGQEGTKWIGNTKLKHADKGVTMNDAAEGAAEVLGALSRSDTESQSEENAKSDASSTASLNIIEKWFGTVEDRSREWFATNAQQWNVVIAIVLAFGLQLDVFQFYRQLQTDDAFRAKLVSAAEDVETQAQEIKERVDQASDDIHQEALAALKTDKDLEPIIGSKLDQGPPSPGTHTQVREWLTKALEASSPIDKIEEAYQAARSDSTNSEADFWKGEFDKIKGTAADINSNAERQGFHLIPESYPHTLWEFLGWFSPKDPHGTRKAGFFSTEDLTLSFSHFLGMGFFAALLSLGAPYWFNLLKTLTNFRPLLAQKVDEEERKES